MDPVSVQVHFNPVVVDNTQAFLEELTALTRKHGLVIGGCGCCGSPFLEDIGDEVSPHYQYRYGRLNEKLEWTT
jgi:hypothetical protein